MKYIFMLFILLANVSYADPFYKEDNPKENDTVDTVVENNEKSTACMPQNISEILRLDSQFEQLKFIGVFQREKLSKALFLDAEQQVIDLKQGLFIFPDMIEIKQVDLKSVQYIDWKNTTDCLNPISVTKKL